MHSVLRCIPYCVTHNHNQININVNRKQEKTIQERADATEWLCIRTKIQAICRIVLRWMFVVRSFIVDTLTTIAFSGWWWRWGVKGTQHTDTDNGRPNTNTFDVFWSDFVNYSLPHCRWSVATSLDVSLLNWYDNNSDNCMCCVTKACGMRYTSPFVLWRSIRYAWHARIVVAVRQIIAVTNCS